MRLIGGFALLVSLGFSATVFAAPVQIVAFGGSNTFGKTVSRAQAYPAQLEARLKAKGYDVVVRNEGVNGITTAEELIRVDSVIPAGTALVIFQPGGNDKRGGRRARGVVKNTKGNISAIIKQLKSRNILVILSTSEFKDIAEEERIPVVDEINRIAPDDMSLDGQHLTAAGYRKVAETLLPVVEEQLKKAGIVANAQPSPTTPTGK